MQNFSQRLYRSVIPGISFILVTVGVLLDILIVERLEEEFDQILVAQSQGLVALAEFEEDGFIVEQYEFALPQFTATENAEYFQFLSDDGELLLSSLSMPVGQLLASPQTRPNRSYLDIILPDGRHGRLLRSRFLPRVDIEDIDSVGTPLELDAVFLGSAETQIPEDLLTLRSVDTPGGKLSRYPLTLYLAISRESLNTLIMQVHLLLITAGVLTMATISMVARDRINNTVKPLGLVTEQVRNLDPDQLGQRITVEDPVSELALLVRQINVLLDRIEQTFQRERQFSGDVAHELRTPLTELLSLVEVKERWPEDSSFEETFLADVKQSTTRMQRTVESLLALSRSGHEPTELLPFVGLPAYLRDMIDRSEERAQQSGITIFSTITDKPIAVCGAYEWPVIIRNLLDNAIDYSAEGSRLLVSLSCGTVNGRMELIVTNTVIDIEEEDLPHLFERLWRKDKSRSSSMHSGLGLSLVKACTDRVGATVACQLHGKELSFSVYAPMLDENGIDTGAGSTSADGAAEQNLDIAIARLPPPT